MEDQEETKSQTIDDSQKEVISTEAEIRKQYRTAYMMVFNSQLS